MVKDIRVTDPYVTQLVERIRARSGEKTTARVAARLIIERAAQLEGQDDEPDNTPPTPVPQQSKAA